MRSPLILIAACLLALALPSGASASYSVGISENEPSMFGSPLFQSLGVKHARVVAAYDIALHPGNFDYNRVAAYVAAADAQGIQPLVALEHVRGDASRCSSRRNFRKKVCRLPSKAAYTRAVRAFVKAFPTVKTLAPWNEANHFTQPTSRNPKRAAQFTNIAARLCKGCKIVVADILDQADNPRAKRPTFRATQRYIAKFRRALKVKRSVCGIHNYSDVNRFRTSGTAALMRALGCRQYWLTETGGLYRFGSFWTKRTRKGCRSAASCQLKATKFLFKKVRRYKRVKRVYVYTWFPGTNARFDAGLTWRDGTARPALAEVRKHI
jgi:hypothetical protein